MTVPAPGEPTTLRDRLAEILTDDDIATLKHLATEGMGDNGLRVDGPHASASYPRLLTVTPDISGQLLSPLTASERPRSATTQPVRLMPRTPYSRIV